MFESSVNSEGIETAKKTGLLSQEFESSVNSEGIETVMSIKSGSTSLRAV